MCHYLLLTIELHIQIFYPIVFIPRWYTKHFITINIFGGDFRLTVSIVKRILKVYEHDVESAAQFCTWGL